MIPAAFRPRLKQEAMLTHLRISRKYAMRAAQQADELQESSRHQAILMAVAALDDALEKP